MLDQCGRLERIGLVRFISRSSHRMNASHTCISWRCRRQGYPGIGIMGETQNASIASTAARCGQWTLRLTVYKPTVLISLSTLLDQQLVTTLPNLQERWSPGALPSRIPQAVNPRGFMSRDARTTEGTSQFQPKPSSNVHVEYAFAWFSASSDSASQPVGPHNDRAGHQRI